MRGQGLMVDAKALFYALYGAHTEADVDAVISGFAALNNPANWHPYGGQQSNFGVVENQQASPIPALIEKIINGIDAIMMRRCLEEKIEPKSSEAPQSIREAVQRFFKDHKNWDLSLNRRRQADQLQILADGPKNDTSLTIVDQGEGQHPEDFEDTLLSLLRGNKNEILFVQGKYNMGGAGALVFCGQRQRYQLIASRRFDESGPFGFTLVRRHPLTDAERRTRKNTWYEYFKLEGEIAAFDSDTLDLRLREDQPFRSGTVVKLYSYQLPPGARGARELTQSLTEYLFEPALPIYTVERPERYPNDRALTRTTFGLKRELEKEGGKYVERSFTVRHTEDGIGYFETTCYVFRTKADGHDGKTTKQNIRDNYFKAGMATLFSLNGQVHGHYTSEFISRTLKLPLFAGYLLIHVNCTEMTLEFRNELFMASRDRLKQGKESARLRRLLGEILSKSELKDIYKARRASMSVDSKDTTGLLKDFARNMPLNSELMKLVRQTFELDGKGESETTTSGRQRRTPSQKAKETSFVGKRFPTAFRVKGDDGGSLDDKPLYKVPLGGVRTIQFGTDAEDDYFDRSVEPGEMRIALLSYHPKDGGGGNRPGSPGRVEDAFNVSQSSPRNGTIKVTLNPTQMVQVGDALEVRVTLSTPEDPSGRIDQVFWARVVQQATKAKDSKVGAQALDEPSLGLPKLTLLSEDGRGESVTWARAEEIGVEIDHGTVMYPMVDENKLTEIFVNIDAKVLKTYRSTLGTAEQLEVADKRYISTVYFHTLFLYAITRSRRYEIQRRDETGDERQDVDLVDYLKDVFANHYSEFLLNFEMGTLIESLGTE